MSKSRVTIEMDFKKAKKQAKNLKEIASKISSERTKMQSCRQQVAKAWSGENSTAYQGKMESIENSLEEIEKKLQKTSDTIYKIAKNTYDAEMKAVALAQERIYSGGGGGTAF